MKYLNHRLLPLIFLAVQAWISQNAHAWSDMGHRYTGILAYKHLSVEKSQKILKILSQHPDYEVHFTDLMPTEVIASSEETKAMWFFSQMACWPDIIKRPEYHYKQQYRKWHYINLPIYLTEMDERFYKNNDQTNIDTTINPSLKKDEWNIIQALKYNIEEFPDAPDSVKAIMLCWILHLIGDLHQPLHSSALFNELRFIKGDAGGNCISIKSAGVLHVAWDHATYNTASKSWNFLGHVDFCDTALLVRSKEIIPDFENGDLIKWLMESHQIAKEKAYPIELMDAVRNSPVDQYAFGNPLKVELKKEVVTALKKSIKLTSLAQITLAGVRTAGILGNLVQ